MNKYIVEFLGTFLLSVVVFSTSNYLAHGAALAIAVMLGGAISGGIFNPAIATGMMVANRITQTDYILYIIVEILGALAGFALVKKIW
jgi:glycerol uptake facilitator-like aquaporin